MSSEAPSTRVLMETAALAARAGAAALEPFARRERALGVEEKAAHDFVTAADLASERAITAAILARHPEHQILGEEGGAADLEPGRATWIVDPVDGTTNFIRGFGVYGISIACAIDGRLVAGAILDPSRDELFTAGRGEGAWLGETPIRVSTRPSLAGALVATGFPFRRHHRLDAFLGTFRAVFAEVSGIRRAGAASLDLAAVACGRFDGFWEDGLGPWDMAAGVLLIEEAGGIVTDFLGAARYLETGAVVAGSPGLHEALRAAVEQHQGDGVGDGKGSEEQATGGE